MRLILAFAALLALTVSVAAEPAAKSKGRAACEALKTITSCEGKRGCEWQISGGKGKCRTLKAEPR